MIIVVDLPQTNKIAQSKFIDLLAEFNITGDDAIVDDFGSVISYRVNLNALSHEEGRAFMRRSTALGASDVGVTG